MSEGYDATYFDAFENLEPRSFWFRERNQLIIDIVDRNFRETNDVLEIGCGSGFALSALRSALPSARLVGVEPFAEGIEIARERVPGAEIVQGVVEDLYYESAFDLACAFDVLEHLDDDVLALRKLHRALKAGGGLMLFVPQHPWLWSGADDFAHHRRRYTRPALLAAIDTAGFDPVLVTSFVSTLLPVLVAARWYGRIGSTPYDPARELVPPFGLNRVFELMLRGERWGIERGARLPAGGTLVIVARKRDADTTV